MLRTWSTFRWGLLLGLALFSRAATVEAVDAQFGPAEIEFFEKQVRPILVARCHECHVGDDAKGNLRLDSRATILAGGDTGAAVVAGNPDKSLLVDAVRYGELYQMPPESQLPAEEIKTLEEWVRRGAPWGADSAEPATPAANEFDLAERSKHWSFQPLAHPRPPQVADVDWIKTPVDRFLLDKLTAAGIKPAPPADRRALLRRVTFDLTGLPPTPAEIDAFVADTATNAYEKVVHRLLASPHYGERWARHWLDLVRFAETHGHEFDFEIPNAYRYRDYVIRALNDDLPYNQFVVEHVAGDLLEPRRNPLDGTNESIVATGWYFFGEAVHSPVDVRSDEATRIDNQIDVFAKTFLGLTVSCARCHDHKFDAISTKDYYALAGYLQSSRYQQALIDAPDRLAREMRELQAVHEARTRLAERSLQNIVVPWLSQLAAKLESDRSAGIPPGWFGKPDPVLDPWRALSYPESSAAAESFAARREAMVRSWREQLDALPVGATIEPGGGLAAWQTSGEAFRVGKPGEFFFRSSGAHSTAVLLTAPTAHSGLLSTKLRGVLRSPTFEITGAKLWYRLSGTGGKVRLIVDGLQLIRDPIYGGLEFAPTGPEARWHSQDLSKWVGHRAYVELVDDGDGYLALEQLRFANAEPKDPPNRAIVEMLDDSALTSPAALADKYQEKLWGALQKRLARDELNRDEAVIVLGVLSHAWFAADNDAEGEDTKRRAQELDEKQLAIEARLTPPQTAPAMADGTGENERVFIRGNHKTLGDEVPRRFLEVLGGCRHEPPSSGSGRLELAMQMVSPECTLVPRVVVNRLWHHHFGAGLVRSPDDFGVMGQPPTHPELLDYLASELIKNDWSLKHVHRLIVLSNAYQMASHAGDAADLADPQNKLWHRMAVRRLEAESIRDAVLSVSGKLNKAMYGPGVKPYLTEFMVGRGRPSESGPLDGDDRRSIYLTVRRNFLPPMFLAFDYPTPFTTIGRRGTSNVPAQALTMMNNPLVIEQAGHWADRVLALPDASPAERVRFMYATAFSRPPDDAELQAALGFVESNDRQAWTDLAHVLFNVKEFIYIP